MRPFKRVPTLSLSMLTAAVRHVRGNVVAYLALFVALGGTAAASTALLVGQSAGGDLAGTYPNPTIGSGKVTSAKIFDGTITDTDVATANKDGTAGTPSLRTLGTGALQAMPGNATPGGPPSGAAGGDLTGTYPNPAIASGAVSNAKLANSSLSVAAGTGLTGGGSVSLGDSTTLGVDPTAVQNRVTGTCSSGEAISSVDQNGAVTCTGVKVIAGAVNANGTKHAGSGFTVSRPSTGNYTIEFPAGTWNGTSLVMITVTPCAFATVGLPGSGFSSDGSAFDLVTLSSTAGSETDVDQCFQFIAAQS